MNRPEECTVTVRRHEFHVPSPTNNRDFLDAIHVALQRYRKVTGKPDDYYADDLLTIESYDDTIRISFIEEVPDE